MLDRVSTIYVVKTSDLVESIHTMTANKVFCRWAREATTVLETNGVESVFLIAFDGENGSIAKFVLSPSLSDIAVAITDDGKDCFDPACPGCQEQTPPETK